MKTSAMKLRAQRFALARMYVDLSLAFHATAFPVNEPPEETDANLALIAATVMMGHAAGRPMNASQIASRIRVPRSSVRRRLETLTDLGLIRRIDDTYYLDERRARRVPRKTSFELILSEAFAVLGPYLSKKTGKQPASKK
jgi:DNA-binding transcriptional ArsR family regulator